MQDDNDPTCMTGVDPYGLASDARPQGTSSWFFASLEEREDYTKVASANAKVRLLRTNFSILSRAICISHLKYMLYVF